jgi:hypothetical protein
MKFFVLGTNNQNELLVREDTGKSPEDVMSGQDIIAMSELETKRLVLELARRIFNISYPQGGA